MRLILLLVLPLSLISSDIDSIKGEVFKKPEDKNVEISSSRPNAYLKIVENIGKNLPKTKIHLEKFLVEILEERLRDPKTFNDFEQFYKVHNLRYKTQGSVKDPGETIYFHSLIDINPSFMHPSLKALIEKYKDIYKPYKDLDRNKFYSIFKDPKVFAMDVKWLEKYKAGTDPDEPPSDIDEEVPSTTLREISDVIHACQITTLEDYVSNPVASSKVLNIRNRILLDEKYLFPLYEAVIFCRDRSMKYNFMELLMYQKKLDYRSLSFLSRQIVFWKDAGLAKLLLKALHKHPSKENLKTVVYILNSSSKPTILSPSFSFSSPYKQANDIKEVREKAWQKLFAELKDLDPKSFQVLQKAELTD